jgi:hypothetical protein
MKNTADYKYSKTGNIFTPGFIFYDEPESLCIFRKIIRLF